MKWVDFNALNGRKCDIRIPQDGNTLFIWWTATNKYTEQLRGYYVTWTVRFYGWRYTGGEITERKDLIMPIHNEKKFVNCEKENFCNDESAQNQFLPASTLGIQSHETILTYQLNCVKASLVELSWVVTHHMYRILAEIRKLSALPQWTGKATHLNMGVDFLTIF